MKSKILFIVVLVLGLAVWWKMAFPSGKWRYKMTVTVETPEGMKTGSAVREVSVKAAPRISPHMLPTVKLRGEALVVDLGERGVLFALLSGYKKGDDYGADIPAIMFSPTQAVMKNETIHYMSRLKKAHIEVPVEWYPKFVHFKDRNDPKTVELVIKMKSCSPKTGVPRSTVCIDKDRFEEIYGEGVRLKSVDIVMTDEEMKLGKVNEYLPWLSALNGGYLHGGRTSREAPLGLYGGNFQAGEK